MRTQYSEPEQIGDILSRIIEQIKDNNKKEKAEKENKNDTGRN